MNDSDIKPSFQQILAGIPGIQDTGKLKRFPSPVLDLFPGRREVLLHDFAANKEYTDEIEWLKYALSTEKIAGGFYLLCNRISEPSLWARIVLSANYEWVEPLWKLSEGMYFMPLDVSYFLQVIYEESIARVYKR